MSSTEGLGVRGGSYLPLVPLPTELPSTCLLSMLLVINRGGEEQGREGRRREGEERGGEGERRGEEKKEKGDIHSYRNGIRMFYYLLWLG